mgnify:CR=1 FL=1
MEGQPPDDHTIKWVEGFIGNEDDPTEPLAAIYYPIYEDAAADVDLSGSDSALNNSVVIKRRTLALRRHNSGG